MVSLNNDQIKKDNILLERTLIKKLYKLGGMKYILLNYSLSGPQALRNFKYFILTNYGNNLGL